MEPVPDKDFEPQRRRSTRIVQAVPLTVTGVDALGRPFQERTSTLTINCHGCRYQSKHYVLKNMWVTFEVPHPETGREPRHVRSRVTWIQRPRTVRELFQIGVELELPGNFWGIAFPPHDWFAFPEAEAVAASIPAPGVEAQAEAATPPVPLVSAEAQAETMSKAVAEEWELPGAAPREDNLRVLPSPSGGEASVTLAHHIARLVVEAKQQVQSSVREATAQAVMAETRPLLTAIHSQLREAAEKAMQAAAGPYAEELVRQTTAKIEEAQQAQLEALREKWTAELQHHLENAGPELAQHFAKVSRGYLASFEQQLETQSKQALEKLNKVSRAVAGDTADTESSLARFRQQIEETAETVQCRWREALERGAEEARVRLEKLEKAARQLNDQVAAATTAAQTGWRGRLDADLAAASTRWNEKVETSLENAARQAAERLARQAQGIAGKLEQELTTRVATLRQSFEEATAEAESALATLRTALSKETTRAKTSLEEIQQVASELGDHSARLEALNKAAAEELERRCQAILETQSQELSRREEAAVADMAERLRPALEAAGQQSVARLTAQLEQQFTPHVDRANQLLEKLTARRGLTEQAVQAHQQRLQQVSDQAVEAAVTRLEDAAGHFQREFQEAGRSSTSKWLAELEAKATDTTHTTFEALYKSADWYEKKVQTHMQATMDRGLEQATKNLREKAGEISGLFASELDHYSRSYVEHSQGQMDEALKDAVESARSQLAEAGETAATTFGDQIHDAAQREFDRFSSSVSSASEQTAARMETLMAQVRSKIDADLRQFRADLDKGLTQEIQKSAERAEHELEAQLAPLKESWRAEREAQQQQLTEALAHLANASVDTYKKRLENVSNTWLLGTATKLNQQSQELIAALARSAEEQLRETCSQVFASVGETLRQRLMDFSTRLPNSTPEKK